MSKTYSKLAIMVSESLFQKLGETSGELLESMNVGKNVVKIHFENPMQYQKILEALEDQNYTIIDDKKSYIVEGDVAKQIF